MAGYYRYNTLDELIEALNGELANEDKIFRLRQLDRVEPELRGSLDFFKQLKERYPEFSVRELESSIIDELREEIKKGSNKEALKFFNSNLLECENKKELLDDKEFILQYLQNEGNGKWYIRLSDGLKSDQDIIRAVARSGGCSELFSKIERFASSEVLKELLGDKDFILQHLGHKGNAADFATISKSLQSDTDVLLSAIKSGGFEKVNGRTDEIEEFNIFDYVPDDLKANRAFILQILSYDETGKFFENFPDKLKHDKEVVLAAVKNYGMALKYVPEELKKDREIVLAAVQSNGIALRVVPDELKNDREVVLEAVKNNIWSIRYIGEDLRSKDASIFAYGIRERNEKFDILFWDRVEMDGKLDTETMERFKNNKEISMAFVINNLINDKNNYVPLSDFAPDEIRNDKSFIMDTIQYIIEHGEELTERRDEAYRRRHPERVNTKQVDYKAHVKSEIDGMLYYFISSVDKSFYEDEEIMYLIAENSGSAARMAGDKFKSDSNFALRAVRSGGKELDWFTDEIRDNDEVVMAAVKRNASQYRFASDRLRGDVSVFLEAITQRDKDGEVIGVDSLFDMYTLPYAKIKFDNDILGQMIGMANGERVCQVFLDLYKKGGLLSDEERDVLQFFIEELDEKMKNPDIDDEKMDKIKKIRDDVNQYVNIQWQYFVDEYNRKLENPDIDDETKESIRARRDRMIAQIEANNKQHSALEVAELDGVKTSDIQSVYEETIAKRNLGKEDKSLSISDE